MTAVNTTADLMLALDDIDDDVVLDLPAIFGNDDPVEIVLGIGKGRYLLGAAKSHTDVNYIGVEVAIKQAVPAITSVLDVTDHAGGDNPYYQPGKGGAGAM